MRDSCCPVSDRSRRLKHADLAEFLPFPPSPTSPTRGTTPGKLLLVLRRGYSLEPKGPILGPEHRKLHIAVLRDKAKSALAYIRERPIAGQINLSKNIYRCQRLIERRGGEVGGGHKLPISFSGVRLIFARHVRGTDGNRRSTND